MSFGSGTSDEEDLAAASPTCGAELIRTGKLGFCGQHGCPKARGIDDEEVDVMGAVEGKANEGNLAAVPIENPACASWKVIEAHRQGKAGIGAVLGQPV